MGHRHQVTAPQQVLLGHTTMQAQVISKTYAHQVARSLCMRNRHQVHTGSPLMEMEERLLAMDIEWTLRKLTRAATMTTWEGHICTPTNSICQ